jgi:hypothetical protein
MIKRLNGKWTRLRDARPGTRFTAYYRRSRREKNHDEMAPRIMRVLLALLLFMVGACLFIFPFVYIPFFASSAALLASESLKVAQVLDRSERWARILWRRAKRRLRPSRRTVHIAALTFGAGCLVLSGVLCYNAFVR